MESRVPDVSQLICKRGKGPTSHLIPFAPRVPLWRCEVFDSQVYRKLSVVLAGVAVLTLAGCSNKASNEAAAAAKKPGAAKLAAAAKAPQPTAMVTVPKGTAISATVGQTLATNKNKVGDTFAASLNAPIRVEGKTVIPKGAQVTGRVVKVKKQCQKYPEGQGKQGRNPLNCQESAHVQALEASDHSRKGMTT